MTLPDWSYQIVLAAEPMSARLARDFVCRNLVAHGLMDLTDDVGLVVSELATNAVKHAQTPFVVTLSMAGGTGGDPAGFSVHDLPTEWFGDVAHTHEAIDDARGYAHLLVELLQQRS